MRQRLLAWCLLTYPKDRRGRDGDYLVDLAVELGASTGVARQALSLLRGGLLERVRGVRRRVVVVAGVAVVALLVAGGVAVMREGSGEVEVQSCADASDGCSAVDDWAADRERHGWRCDLASSRDDVSWQCTRP